MEILDDTSANWLVRFDDGHTETVAKSKQNRLLMEHDLWGLLRDGSEVFQAETDDGTEVRLVPVEDAREFILRVGEYEPLHLGAHRKGDVVDALFEGRDPDTAASSSENLMALFDEVREQQVRAEVVEHFEDLPLFDGVERDSRGWLFNGHLLLTYDGEFYHPEMESKTRSGSIIEADANQEAYELDVTSPPGGDREVTFNGTTYRLTNAEMEFLAKALWAVENAPEVA